MKKNFELIFTALKIPVDYLFIILSALTAYFFRYSETITKIRPIIFDLPIQKFLILTLIGSLFWIFIFAWIGLYTMQRLKFTQELSKIIQACSLSIMAITTYMVFIREIFSSRFIIVFTWLFSIIFVTIGRILMRFLKNYLHTKNLGIYRTVIIGKNRATEVLYDLFSKHKSLGIKIIKIIDPKKNDLDNIFKNLKKLKIEQIIQTDTTLSRKISSQLIDFCQENHIIYQYVGGDFESKVTNNEIYTYAGIPIIEIKRTPLDGWGKIVKRIIDIIGAIFGIIIFSPIMIATAIAIKLTSPGPIFADMPKRAGQYLKPFRMYKFRSMYVGAHKDQKKYKSERKGLFKLKNDPRITKVGKFIRKTSIDELPQFFNVLLGQMSLVGPRPHFVYEYNEKQKRVLDIKPGITGLAQISGRSDLSFDEEIKLDLYYIENWSIWLDLWILFKTPIILITKINSAV